jgi:hypothetical protein
VSKKADGKQAFVESGSRIFFSLEKKLPLLSDGVPFTGLIESPHPPRL